jgi:uncharacterized membrane protein YccC
VQLLKPLLAVALTAYFVPLLAPLVTFGTLAQNLPGTINTQIGSLIAAVTALLAFRRVTIYPGRHSVLPRPYCSDRGQIIAAPCCWLAMSPQSA